MPIAISGTGRLNDSFHAHFCEIMILAAAREGLFCPVLTHGKMLPGTDH